MRAIVTVAAFLALAGAAQAQGVESFYRNTNIKLVIGVAPGGSYDIIGRLVGRHLGKHVPGEPKVLIENMPGASGRVATNHLFSLAAKDGSVIGAVQETAALGQLLGEPGVRYDAGKFGWI